MANICGQLIEWFQDHKKDYSFRWQEDPFRVLIAGILLKRTTALQATSIYPKIIDSYGIRSRARELIDISKIIVKEHEGLVPANYDELIKLPGVGDYIASCVLALGFRQPLPMVDASNPHLCRINSNKVICNRRHL